MLAVIRSREEGPRDEFPYCRLRLIRQALRHRIPSAFGKPQLRATSRHYGKRFGACLSDPVEFCQGLHISVHHELGDPLGRQVKGWPEIWVDASRLAQVLKSLFRAAYPRKENTEVGIVHRISRVDLDRALQMAQRCAEAASVRVKEAECRVARAFTVRELGAALRQAERAIEHLRRSR
jgi:hypothetical protein